MKKIVSLLFICLLITGCGSKYTVIDYNKAVEILKEENTVIIDVRGEDEYNSGHIKDAINIPLDNISKIEYDKNIKIILYFAIGGRNSETSKKVRDLEDK